MDAYDYDLAVIGSGPAGQRAAVQAAKLGKSVCVVERHPDIGGVSAQTVIASKTLREAVLHLTGYRERSVYGESYQVKEDITMGDLMTRTNYAMRQQADIQRNQLLRNRVAMFHAEGSFVDAHTINLATDEGESNRAITADKIVIAVGTQSPSPPTVFVDGELVYLSDDALNVEHLPRSLIIVGGGAIGLEYASTYSALGIRVTVVDRSSRLLSFADDEIVDTLVYHLRQRGVTFRMNENVFDIEYARDERGRRVRVLLESGKQIVSDAVMYCVGREGVTEGLNLAAAGLEADARGRLEVDETFRTAVDNIYAVGGVIGFPDLVSSSGFQGRLAACHAFGVETSSIPQVFPYTVKTIPEIAMVGRTEAQLTEANVAYEVGKSRYHESMRSVIIGDDSGLLKLLFDIETRQLLGVHIIGEGAAEIVHVGQAVIAHGGTVDYFTENVVSHPSLVEGYVTAALDGINRLL